MEMVLKHTFLKSKKPSKYNNWSSLFQRNCHKNLDNQPLGQNEDPRGEQNWIYSLSPPNSLSTTYFFKEQKKILDIWDSSNSSKGAIQIIRFTADHGRADWLGCWDKFVQKACIENWFVYIILTKTT